MDGLMALMLAGIGIVVERQTQGRLFTETIVLWVGIGSFVLLRSGAVLARAGRTLGCGFVFTITWLLPCAVLLYMMTSTNLQRVMRDSFPFFIYLGFVLIFIMLVTFERLRLADEARHNMMSDT